MRLCSGLILLVSGAAVAPAASIVVQPVYKPSSVVRVDRRTGKLVRTVVIASKSIQTQSVSDQVGAVIGGGPTLDSRPAVISGWIEETARTHEVDPALIHSVIQVESNYNPNARSSKGALGLMQLMPATAKRFGVRDVFDPRQNIEGGVRYLKYLSSLFPDDLRLALAAYNAGEGAVARYGNNIPPYAETEAYVYNVGRRYGQARAKSKISKTPAVAAAAPAEPPPPPVRSFVDSNGRLHLTNSSSSGTE